MGARKDRYPAGMTRTCPNCSKPAQEAYQPFCSRRCADVDLQRWLAGVHVVPGGETEGEAADDDAASGRPGQVRRGPL